MPLKYRHHLLLRASALALFVACFIKRMSTLAIADEYAFLQPIERWVKVGPSADGLWHSPLYPWLLTFLGRLFSVSEGPFRLVGFFSILLAAGFAFRAATLERPQLEEWRKTFLVAFFLLSPVALGSSLLLDYDTTLLVASTAGYFYLLVRYSTASARTSGAQHFGAEITQFGLALAACLLSKETTPLIYPLGHLVVAHGRTGSLTSAFARAAAGALLGVAVFVAACAIWCASYGVPLSAVFAMDVLGLHMNSGEIAPWRVMSLTQSVWLKLMPFVWLGLPIAALFLSRLPALFRADHGVRAITAVTCAVLVAYTFALKQTTYHFPKYMSPVLVWVPWLLLVPEREGRSHSNMSAANFRVWTVATVAWFVLMPIDPLALIYERNADAAGRLVLMLTVPLAIWGLVRFLNLASWSLGSPRASTIALLCALGLSLSYCRSALISKGSITYWYGDRAIPEAREVVREWLARNPGGQVYLPAKDLAWGLRDFGAEFVQRESLGNNGDRYCAQTRSFLVVTRAREDSSLTRYDGYEPLRKCLPRIREGVDILYAEHYSSR